MNKMNLFNFYIDDDDKANAIAKLDRLCGNTSKGKLAAFLRIQIKKFNLTPDEKITRELIEAIDAEYVMCKNRNKRSSM